MKHAYRLIIAYDGTDYYGWQFQNDRPSVEGVIRKTFLRSFKQKDVLFVGASRTDAGVHARGQTARLKTDLLLEPHKLMTILNRALPRDIQIVSCIHAPDRFHPHHDVLMKTYTYSFSLQKPSPQESRFLYYFPWDIDIKTMQEALRVFEGTHDFSYFCKEAVAEKSKIKTITSIMLEEKNTHFIITIKGTSFLRYMIRRIVGAAFAVASHQNVSLQELKETLSQKNKRAKLLITAPAHGLCLSTIDYKN